MLTFPNAKINIGLNIVEKRADGYHNIESCFYPINWHDVLEILPAKTLSFKGTGIEIPGKPDSNLCLKAYQLLKADFDLPAFEFHLHKVIPIGAGLGGGSSDGAFALKLLNEINRLGLSNEILENYAKNLGADCAFFIENKPKFCFGKGDEFEKISLDLSGKFIVLINPNIHISTAEAYSGVVPKKPLKNIKEIIKLPTENWRNNLQNDFEESLFSHYPILHNLKNELYRLDALYASMTGSGSTVYGIFEREIDLEPFSEFMTFQAKL